MLVFLGGLSIDERYWTIDINLTKGRRMRPSHKVVGIIIAIGYGKMSCPIPVQRQFFPPQRGDEYLNLSSLECMHVCMYHILN